MRTATLQRIDTDFAEKVMRIYPSAKSMREATEKLNEELEKILYGIK